jgi:hypothetical protein
MYSNLTDQNESIDLFNFTDFDDTPRLFKNYHNVFLNIKISTLLVLIGVGLIGNTLSLIIFSKKSMRQVSTFRYLLYLSLFDLFVLIVSAAHLLVKLLFKIDVRLYSSFACKTHTFLTYFFTHVCSMILIAVNVDRVLKMKKIRELKNGAGGSLKSKLTREIIKENQITIDVTNENRVEELKFNIKRLSSTSKQISIKVRFKKNEPKLKFEAASNAGNWTVEENHVRNRGATSLLKKCITVDFVMVSICFALFLLNFHFILLLKFESVNVEELSFLNEEEFQNASIHLLGNETLAYERCDAERGTLYENFLSSIWFWIDMSTFSFIPLVFMCVCSVILLFEFRKLNANYFRLIADERYELNKEQYLGKIKRNRKICMILFKSSFYFCFVMLEYWLSFFFFKRSNFSNKWLKELHSFSYLFIYTNNVFNFFIYGLNSEKYRSELQLLFVKRAHRMSSA